MNSVDIYLSAAHKFLCCGNKKKRLSSYLCLDLTVQVLAVDLGLKPALLYDSNAASAEQLLHYANSLQETGVLSAALQIVSIDGNSLIVNPELMKAHLEELLQKRSLITVDICPWSEQPTTSGTSRSEDMVKDMFEFFKNKEDICSSVIVVDEELYGSWNLCTLFGILLGYPASYWFDQTQGFENCLSMTPLVVNKVQVCWGVGDGRHCSCLYSFSVPEVLWGEVCTHIEQWAEHLRDRFSKQTVLTELSFSKETVVLPSVTL